jgi:DNA helicase-2/ATP-dependent DNA helicase PcrA
MTALGRPAHERVVLQESYRSPPAVEALARGLLDPAAPPPPDGDPALAWSRFASPCHLAVALARALRELRDRDPSAAVAVILRHAEAAQRLHAALERAVTIRLVLAGEFTLAPGACVSTVEQVKGLEFSHVVVPDASTAAYPDDPRSRRALYVAVTRAMHQVWLCSDGPWSPLRAGRAPTTHSC